MSKLVIVESPAKVKTIRKFLPSDFKVDSCYGHIRDLPAGRKQAPKAVRDEDWADLGVNVDEGYEPIYITIRGSGKHIKRLKKHLKDAEALYLATDEDREGESISWHLAEALDPKVPVKRMVFNEITKEAIQSALDNPRDIDMDLVQAQETRRILDRLYGFRLSDLLRRKIGGNLSAGRVQTPAVRLVVNRERERRAFRSGTYWDLQALLEQASTSFEATLFELDGTRVATGADFDEDTGELKEDAEVVLVDEEQATDLAQRLPDAVWTVVDVQERHRQSKPPTPFKTSTLQQEASGRINLSPGQTMRVAQDLYEEGWITYMRTDSIALSEEALEGAKKAIVDKWGSDLHHRRAYARGEDEGAQEAHEAIRPAGATFTPPSETGLSGPHKTLYDMIYRRTLASQMPNEKYTSTTVLVDAAEARFKATGKHTTFEGYRLAWPTRSKADQLPRLETGDKPNLRDLEARPHETQPPSRYTEASLVEALEEEGIGRPSTYAAILEKIQDREYVLKDGRSLVPTFKAFFVAEFLERYFARLVDTDFTADMEAALDEIAAGKAAWKPYLEGFYRGEDGLDPKVEELMENVDPREARAIELEGLPYPVKISRYGAYLEAEIDGETVTADLPDGLTPDELTKEKADEILERRAEGPRSLGTDPASGLDIYLMTGRYGPYVQLGETDEVEGKPDRASLPDGMGMDEVTLDDAIFLLSLPKEIGDHPDGGSILVGLGRYGPYVCHDPPGDKKRIYANTGSYEEMAQIAERQDVDGALELIAKKRKRSRRGVLREMGDHPETGKPIELRGGKYGPYFKHDGENKSLPDAMDIDDATVEDAVFLLSLPEDLGEHPDGGHVFKDLGRYGPWIWREVDGDRMESANLEGGYEQLKTIDLDEAVELLAEAE